MEAITGVIFGAVSVFIAVSTYVAGIRREYRQKWEAELAKTADAEVKKFAAQREFEHLKRNYENLQQTLKTIADQMDDQERSLIELKTNFTGIFNQLQSLSARFDSSTSGWTRPQIRRKSEDDI